jgi:phosphatidate cytidylyltransferase
MISSASLIEFYQLTEKGGFHPQKVTGVIIGGIIFILTFLSANKIIDDKYLLFIFSFIPFIFITEIYLKSEHPFRNLSFTFFGIIYVSMPMALLNFITTNEFTYFQFSYKFILPFFFMLWASDTGAYIVGSLIGKHKLIERISPKKTWEGLIGGIFFSILTAIIFHQIIKEFSIITWIIMAIVISIMGVYGDLSESLLKRRANVKDSGHLLPGHGGVLDRFDSILFATPIVFIYIKILGKI